MPMYRVIETESWNIIRKDVNTDFDCRTKNYNRVYIYLLQQFQLLHVFDNAYTAIYRLVEQDSFRRFVKARKPVDEDA